MAFDIRLPIGILFTVLGAILMAFGALSDPAIYRLHSLGVNINLIWGAAMTLFGLLMLGLAGASARKAKRRPKP